MRVAIQICGLPRFSREFDHFLTNIIGYTEIDYHFLFWNNDPKYDSRTPPDWPVNNINESIDKIKRFLPDNHNIATYEINSQPHFDQNKIYRLTPWSQKNNILSMYYGIKTVNDQRKLYENKRNFKYDLIIRTRPDIGLQKIIDLKLIKDYLNNNVNHVIMPANERHGMGVSPVNDFFAIALPNIMDIYSSAYDYIDQYNSEGMILHGETVLGYHLQKNNIYCPSTNFNYIGRYYTIGPNNDPDFGRWN